MRFRKSAIGFAAGALTAALALAACSAEDLANSPAGQAAKDQAIAAATSELQQQIGNLGFQNVTVVVEDEDETVKVSPSAKPAQTTGKAAPTPSASGKPKATATGKASAVPTASTVKFQVLSATASYPQTFRCGFNVEWRLDKYGVPTGKPYFDEVLVPGTEGVEVEGAARNDMSFKGMTLYVFTRHPECILPGVTAAPAVPVPAASGATTP